MFEVVGDLIEKRIAWRAVPHDEVCRQRHRRRAQRPNMKIVPTGDTWNMGEPILNSVLVDTIGNTVEPEVKCGLQ
jgi:hypothetical protein